MYLLLQTASAAILFFGANTSFNGFPALTSFVAEDSFLPRPMMKRGHRLVFSNAIIVLTALSTTLVIVTGGSVDAVVPLFAMGVFTGFSMAGYGMTKYYLTHRAPGWRRKVVINLSAAILSTIVVLIFAVAKFTEGAWLVVVVVFPILVFALMRLNRQYRAESSVLENLLTERQDLVKHPRHRVFVFVDHFDLALIEALHYASGLHADKLTAVHFVIDALHATRLQQRWEHFEDEIPLRMLECPDRNLSRVAQELVMQEIDEHPGTKVTVLLPRRTYAPLVGRLLHDRTADKMAGGHQPGRGRHRADRGLRRGIADRTGDGRGSFGEGRREAVERVADPRLTSSGATEPGLLEVEVAFNGAQQRRADAAVASSRPVAPTARQACDRLQIVVRPTRCAAEYVAHLAEGQSFQATHR